MTFEDFKKEFDTVFESITPQELVTDFEKMGYRFVRIEEDPANHFQWGRDKAFVIKNFLKVTVLSSPYPRVFEKNMKDNSLLLAA